MSLTQGAIEVLRTTARSAGGLPPQARQAENARARVILARLRESLTPEEAPDPVVATVCLVFAQAMGQLGHLSVRDLAEVLEVTPSAYALSAAHLMGLYDVDNDPEVPAGAPGPGGTSPKEWGGYL